MNRKWIYGICITAICALVILNVTHILTGGSSQIWGMDRLLAEVTKIPCVVADDADSCCAYGCGKSLGWIRQMQEGTINIARKKLLKD